MGRKTDHPRRRLRRLAGLLVAAAVVVLLVGAAWAADLPSTEYPVSYDSGCADWREAPESVRRSVSEGAADRLAARAPELGLRADEVPDATEVLSHVDASCVRGDRHLPLIMADLIVEVLRGPG